MKQQQKEDICVPNQSNFRNPNAPRATVSPAPWSSDIARSSAHWKQDHLSELKFSSFSRTSKDTQTPQISSQISSHVYKMELNVT